MSFSAWNGLGLALVIPCVQSLIADTYSSASRGRAFGLLFFTSSLGGSPPACHDKLPESCKICSLNADWLSAYRCVLCHYSAHLLQPPVSLWLRLCSGDAGGKAGGFFATSVGNGHVLGVEGWRFAFFLIASVSVFTGILTLFIASDPRRVRPPS